MSITRIENKDIFCSVVMPVHNGERFLREAIESVLNQTYSNFEFLIVENCSTDSSVEIIKSYNDPRIKLIFENKCGQVHAYNRGFSEAEGKYIFIHDQDDISRSDRFEKQLNCMIKNNIDICGSFFNLINTSGEVIGQISVPVSHMKIIDELLYKNYVIFNSSVCIKNTVFKELKGFDIHFFPSADYDFYLRGRNKFTYGNVAEFLYSWRRHSTQISSKYLKNIPNKTIAISLKNRDFFPRNMKKTYEGLVYYYNDKLLTALNHFVQALFYDKFSKKLLRYLFITVFFGLPLKIFRKSNWLNSKIFLNTKKNLDKIF